MLSLGTFADLLDLPYNPDTGKIDIQILRNLLPNAPESVLLQLFHEQGRNPDFQNQYKHLKLHDIYWSEVQLKATEIITCTVLPSCKRWFDEVGERTAEFPAKGWRCIDERKDVRTHWQKFETWLIPPVMLSSDIFSLGSALHLVEGHTRIGLLSGLVRNNVLQSASVHTVMLGTAKAK